MFSLKCGWGITQIQGARAYQEDRFAVVDGATLHIDGRAMSVAEFGVGPSQMLVVVVDGMGGMGHGDIAAELVTRQFVETWLDFAAAGTTPRDCLHIAAHAANQRLAQAVRETPDYAGMGSTLLAVFFDWSARVVWWISVGDSLLLRLRGNTLSQLNEEHSARRFLALQQESARSRGEAPEPPPQSMLDNPAALVSAITGDPLEWIDLPETPMPIRSGDLFVVASDGLDYLPREELAARLSIRMPKPKRADRATALVQHARDIGEGIVAALNDRAHPRQDNATLAVVRFTTR